MKQLLILIASLVLLAPAVLLAQDGVPVDEYDYPTPTIDEAGNEYYTQAPRITGKKWRKQCRYSRYPEVLKGDKKRVFEKHGWCYYRNTVYLYQGRINEVWDYHRLGLRYTFDEKSRLVRRDRIPKEDWTVTGR